MVPTGVRTLMSFAGLRSFEGDVNINAIMHCVQPETFSCRNQLSAGFVFRDGQQWISLELGPVDEIRGGRQVGAPLAGFWGVPVP